MGIIIGILLGAACLNALVSYRIDAYLEEIEHLKTVIEDKEIRLKKLEESVNKRKLILKDINVVLIYEGDEMDKIALEKHIKEKYTKLLGKEVKTIDLDLIGEIIDNRIMKINNKEYSLKLNKIFLSDILKIFIEAQ